MAAKRGVSTASSTQPLARLRDSMRTLQRDAQKLLQQTRKQASAVITRDQRKALDRLLGQARRLRTDLEKRAQRAGKEIETRTERFLAGIEREARKRVAALLGTLDVATRRDVQGLARRLTDLEKRLQRRPTPRPKPAVRRPVETPPPASSGESGPL
jgi:F0F1-type ATP synthase membrane subunit b/b'